MYINNNTNFRMLHRAVNVYVVNVCRFISLIFDFMYEWFFGMQASAPHACSDHRGQMKVQDALD